MSEIEDVIVQKILSKSNFARFQILYKIIYLAPVIEKLNLEITESNLNNIKVLLWYLKTISLKTWPANWLKSFAVDYL